MPKKSRSSIGRKYKRSWQNEGQIPSKGPQNDSSISEEPMDVLIEASDTNRTDVTAVHINEDSALVFRPTSDENTQPGPSELSCLRVDEAGQVVTLSFEQQILTLSKKRAKNGKSLQK